MSKKAGPEKKLQNSILTWCKGNAIFAFPIQNGGIYDPVKKLFRRPSKNFMPGISDILGLHKGKMFALELKHGKYTKPTPEQDRFLRRVIEDGGYSAVIRSFKEFEIFIQKILAQKE